MGCRKQIRSISVPPCTRARTLHFTGVLQSGLENSQLQKMKIDVIGENQILEVRHICINHPHFTPNSTKNNSQFSLSSTAHQESVGGIISQTRQNKWDSGVVDDWLLGLMRCEVFTMLVLGATLISPRFLRQFSGWQMLAEREAVGHLPKAAIFHLPTSHKPQVTITTSSPISSIRTSLPHFSLSTTIPKWGPSPHSPRIWADL